MELRSGRTLRFVNQNTVQEVSEMIQELKTLFEMVFYHMGERLGIEVKLRDFKVFHGRSPNLIELDSMRVNKESWHTIFHKVWNRMQEEFPPEKLLHLIPYVLLQEYAIQPEHPLYLESHGTLANYIRGLYESHNCDKMIELMSEEHRINEQASVVHNKKLYLNHIALRLIGQVFFLPEGTFTKIIPWEKMLKSARDECCFYYEKDGGCTVVKLPYTYSLFSMPPAYEYKILETGQKFTSCETNARKALLLHKRCTEKD